MINFLHRKYLFFIIGAFILFSLGGIAGEKPAIANPYVKCTAEVKKKTLKPGEKGELLISLQPIRGIHINLTPPMSVHFDSTGQLQSNGAMDIPKKETFLDVAKRIRIPFALSPASKSDTALLKATLTYYYCSDAEGWCSKYTQPIEMTMTVTK